MRADVQLNAAEQAVERDLRRYFTGGDPAPAFVAQLEQQLVGQAVTAPTVRPAPGFLGRWLAAPRPMRWAAVVAALLLVLTVTIGALGPQRVWAEVQRLLGYVPGIGFVNLKDTRVLVAPVEVTRKGVTVRVEQVIAEPERTRLVIRGLGLPPSDTIFQPGASVSENVTNFSGRLRLPDGSALDFKELFLQYGEAASRLEFAGLPSGVMSFTLELDRLPLVPPGRAPESWRIPVTLVSAEAPGVSAQFPEPYKPAGASDTHHGLTISVENVAHTGDETIIKLRGTWSDPALQIYGLRGGMATPWLLDNVGHVYGFKSSGGSGGAAVAVVQKVVVIEEGVNPTSTPTVRSLDDEFTVEPLSAFARQVTLQVESIQSEVTLGDTFRITIPEGAQVGDRWPLDLTLDVAGFPVRLTGAALEMNSEALTRDGQPVERTLLTFQVAPVPEQDNKRLSFFYLEAPAAGWGSGPGSGSVQNGSLSVSLELTEGAAIRPGPIDVTMRGASIHLLGPWRMTWIIPGREGQATEPATLYPQAQDAHDGLTLGVQEVVHTDRLTHVLVDLQDAPPGVALAQAQVMWYDDRLRGDQLGFEDDRGRRYEWDRSNISWLRPGETYSLYYQPKLGAQSLRLPPVDPLAARFTLTLPTIEVVREAAGSFTMSVPADIELKGHMQPPGIIQESAPWPVDIAVQVGDQTVRYSEARVTAQQNGHMWVILGNSDRSPFSDPGVSGLCNTTIIGPTGEAVTSAQDNFVMGSGPCTFAPGFSPQDAAGRLVPGEYRVSFDGIAVRVRGPWQLSWDVRP